MIIEINWKKKAEQIHTSNNTHILFLIDIVLFICFAQAGRIILGIHTITAEWFKSREDRPYRQVYVRNIPDPWSDEQVLKLFEAQTLGKIKSFNAIDKLDGCPTGDPACPTLSVSRFMYKADRDNVRLNQGPGGQTSFAVYVGNLPNQLTDEQLYQLFCPFGSILSTTVLQKTEEYKYGFVNFEFADDAAKALLHMNGKVIGGKTLQVKPTTKDVTKAVAISQAANSVHENTTAAQMQMESMRQQMDKKVPFGENHTNMDAAEAEMLLTDGKNIKVWKVQYGEEWHEYDMALAGVVESLGVGQQIQIPLADSDYVITRLSATEALQQNLSTGTTRKVIRIMREKKATKK
ncbi:hypothetical protein RFI_09044 [Reticulomyxa filosa]|uniref:RRM domain-containing protein n=1 Tax=Reticulomyxa filosa TaxID=46433 RepID=X6NPZ5_RETFI|nr:hypothetical protein RFI_09044 [Reticulomyxa filosa]|eukprot:ETO28091.1 hypothetical protein RFI_09044 [Reticulomyxa filosa]